MSRGPSSIMKSFGPLYTTSFTESLFESVLHLGINSTSHSHTDLTQVARSETSSTNEECQCVKKDEFFV